MVGRFAFCSDPRLLVACRLVCAFRLGNVKRWVEAESEHKKKQPFDFTGWDVMAQEDCPQQHNGFDCGVRSASRGRC